MSQRLAILLLFVTVVCIAIRVGAQQDPSATGLQPPSLESIPRLLPPPVPPPPPQLTPPRTPPPSAPPETPAIPKPPGIAGIPYEEALAVFEHRAEELKQLPGVVAVWLEADGIHVYTSDPAVLPTAIEGLPVTSVTSLGDGETQKEIFPPPSLQCGSGTQWDTGVGRCKRTVPLVVSPPVYLPPPSGVIVLRPGGVREQADSCPEGFKEVIERGDWHFCIDPGHPEPVPPLMVPPIAGIPYEECLAILERHREELLQISGVKSVGMGAEGIVVEIDNAAILPLEVEGLPIKAIPPTGLRMDANHTLSSPVRPLHGSVAVSEAFQGTLTSVVLSKGRPWLIFPTHILANCQNVSPCPPGSPADLNGCPHNSFVTGTRTLVQPPSFPQTVGFVQRWDPLNGSTPSIDTAAAFMDNNTVKGDGSLLADRRLEVWGSFTGVEAQPAVNDTVQAGVSSINPHILGSGVVRAVNQTFPVGSTCNGGLLTPQSQQITIEITSGNCIVNGDSGSPILNSAGSIIGTLNWFNTGNSCIGGGVAAPALRTRIGFDTWHGTNTTDLSVQVHPTFRTVVQGQSACAWVYIKNTGTVPA